MLTFIHGRKRKNIKRNNERGKIWPNGPKYSMFKCRNTVVVEISLNR